MDESAAEVFSAFSGMGADVGRSFVSTIKELINPEPVSERPARLASTARLRDFAITNGREFLYDLGLMPDLMIAIKCRNVEAISDPAESCPTVLARSRKKCSV